MLNLYNILLEQVDCERLIAEGKDPVEVLHYKFQDVPSEVIDKIIEIDPTKKKSYSQWLLGKYKDESELIDKCLKNGKIEKLFDYYKNHNEIQIKDCPSVKYGIENYVQEEDTVLDKSSEPETYIKNQNRYVDSELANDFDIVFNKDNWLIAVPHTYEAAGKLGENTRWCTTGCYGDDRYYENYLRQGGEYYVNFDLSRHEKLKDKEYPYKRYQFHFESNQFMDSHDDPVNEDACGIPQSAIDFYQEIDEDYVIEKSYEERYEEYDNWRYQNGVRINDGLWLLVDFDEDFERVEINDNTKYYIYDASMDDRDPLCWEELNADCVEYSYGDNMFILKKAYGEGYVIVLASDSEAFEICGNYIRDQHRDGVIFAVVERRYVNSIMKFEDGYGYVENAELKKLSDDAELFINSQCEENWDRDLYVIEVVNNDGYHSLITFDGYETETIILRDIPINGKYFEVDENGEIKGEFRTYSIDESSQEEDYENSNYRLSEILSDGNYLVEVEDPNREGKDVYTIISKTTRKPIFNGYFLRLLKVVPSIGYCANIHDNVVDIIQYNGERIFGDKYANIEYLNDDTPVIACEKPNQQKGYVSTYDIYDLDAKQYLIENAVIDFDYGIVDGSIIMLYHPNGPRFLYDIKNKENVANQYINFQVLSRLYHPNRIKYLVGGNEDGTFTIMSLDTKTVIVNNVSKMDEICFHGPIKYDTTDGGVNILSIDSFGKMFEHDVKQINDSSQDRKLIFGEDFNNTVFCYNYENKKYIIKNLPINKYTLTKDSYDDLLWISNGKLTIGYVNKSNPFYLYQNPQNGYRLKLDENAPQEFKQFVKEVSKYINIDESNNVTEQFHSMLNRINEARKRL